MVAVTAALVKFIAVKDPISPVPLPASPIEGVLFIQLNSTLLPPPPLLGLVNAIAVVDAPLHNTWLGTASTVAVGLTVMVKLIGVPTHVLGPPAPMKGVTVIVATIGTVVVLVAVNEAISPIPAPGIPIEGSLFVHVKTVGKVPVAGPLKWIAAVDEPLHNTWSDTAFTVAIGFTVIVNEIGVPVHVIPALVYIGVTVIVADIAFVWLFTVVNDGILPMPLAANPMEVLLLVQL